MEKAEKRSIPQFDIPVDYVMSNDIEAGIVRQYGNYPCRIQAAILGIVVKGHLHARINLKEYEVHAGEFFVLMPNSFIMLQDSSDDLLVSIVGFSSEFSERCNLVRNLMPYYNMVVANPVMPVSEDLGQLLIDSLNLLVQAQELPESPLNSDAMVTIVQLISQMMAPIYSELDGGVQHLHMTRSEQIARDFSLLVMQHYTKEHRVNYYAEQLHLCLPYLCSVIKEETDQTATQIINRAIITDAKSQLKATDAQIKSIAFSLGFDNVSFFNKFFKLQTGMTPKQYRES